MEKNTVTISRGARNILLNILQGNDWYGSPKYAYVAGELLVKVFPDNEEVPKQGGEPLKGEVLVAWLQETSSYELDKRQLKVCKACLTHYLEKKALAPNRFLYELMTKLEMAPEETD